MNRVKLNLPECELRVRMNTENGFEEIFCPQRHKWVKLTPEEWVRQNFVDFLISQKHFPRGRVANELPITVGKMQKRCDSVVFDAEGKPLVICEYKATSVALTQKVFDQIVRYNFALRVKYLIVSNGLQHYCCRLNQEKNQFEFLREIPEFQEL